MQAQSTPVTPVTPVARARQLVPWPVLAALIGSALIVLIGAYIARENGRAIGESSDTVIQAGEVLDVMMRLRGVLHAAESAQRGFVLTGNREYLGPYERSGPTIELLLGELKSLSSRSESQMRRLVAVEQLTTAKQAEMRSSIAAMDRGERQQAVNIVMGNRGLEIMDALLAILTELRAEELSQRTAYKELLRKQTATSKIVELGTTAVLLSQLALCYVLLARYLRKRRESEAELAALTARLEDEIQERTHELSGLSRHLITVREDEKARIARELHDEMGSSLTALNMDLDSAQRRLDADSPALPRLARASVTLKSTVDGMRRIIEDLRPTMLESLGLREALRALAADTEARIGIPIVVDVPDELPPLPDGVPISLYRIVQEALTNASRYSKASSVAITLRAAAGGLVLVVEDDGIGFKRPAKGEKRASHGLLGIRERAIAMGGTSSVGRGADGRGTAVRVVVPSAAAP